MGDHSARIRTGIVPAAVLIVCLTGACGTESGPTSGTTTSTIPDFPYAPHNIRTDVAVDLKPPLLDAAQFAAEMSIDNRLESSTVNGEVNRRFRSRIAPEADSIDLPPVPDNFIGATGGALHRAVGARELSDGTIEVTVCSYDTPGLYTKRKDGKIIGPDPKFPYFLSRPRVQWTDRPAADGSTPGGPRWLLLDSGYSPGRSAEEVAEVCEPFKPEPFVQKMPDPTSTTPSPTTR